MTPERFKEVGRIYQSVIALEVVARPVYLAEACAGDEALRAEIEALLSYDTDTAFLDRPALELATQILEEKSGHSLAGQHVGRCELLSLLGKGGMGEVWLAEDKELRRRVAVKLLPDEFTSDPSRTRRFTQEARAASASIIQTSSRFTKSAPLRLPPPPLITSSPSTLRAKHCGNG